ncbi:phage tail protein [Acidovorax sp. MR-S7]|uniref:phage tail protein n=1 Tax=Acidovorax sp. MR-S7 TaxID=1268622 RepID=UPI00037961EA|nr:tail fiber protein [Acidovorax sp. MR-S7]GAD24726.1 microcystin-dependent protein [Acidovorax sp. MR-S7]
MARTKHSSTLPLRHAACALALLAACTQVRAEATDPFVGALMPMAGKPGGSTCPLNWLPAEGQVLAIQQYPSLFSILGNAYGGNGTSTFALPDLRARVPVGAGAGPGLTPLDRAEAGGSATVTLLTSNLPAHQHGATAAAATHATPDPSRMLAQAQNAGVYAPGGSGSQVALGNSYPAGSGQPVPTISPYLSVIWCIAANGAFPPYP